MCVSLHSIQLHSHFPPTVHGRITAIFILTSQLAPTYRFRRFIQGSDWRRDSWSLPVGTRRMNCPFELLRIVPKTAVSNLNVKLWAQNVFVGLHVTAFLATSWRRRRCDIAAGYVNCVRKLGEIFLLLFVTPNYPFWIWLSCNKFGFVFMKCQQETCSSIHTKMSQFKT